MYPAKCLLDDIQQIKIGRKQQRSNVGIQRPILRGAGEHAQTAARAVTGIEWWQRCHITRTGRPTLRMVQVEQPSTSRHQMHR